MSLPTQVMAGPGDGPAYDQYEGEITAAPTIDLLALSITLERGGVLTIIGSTGNDVASAVSGIGRGTITAKRGAHEETFDASTVNKIVFHGYDGDDSFTNNTSIPCEAYGNDGNDTLTGGTGADFLVGGYGQDTINGNAGADVIWGSGGSDILWGGTGEDLLKGHGGNDQLNGGTESDALYGGSGDDTLNGGTGQDTLVSIGGNFDTITGGTSNDFFWVDTTDSITDPSGTEANEAFINDVASFYAVSYGGGPGTPIAKDLTNFDLPDPLPTNWDVDLANFGDRPLFGNAGPGKEDVIQGAGNDCFILGPLSAVADATPDSIRKLVVDLDDGTYAVRFFRNAGEAPQYVRVDADLWIDEATGNLEYARLGLVDEALWVPIVEKAFALFRRQDGAYASISGGNGSGPGDVILGADKSWSYMIDPIYDAEDVAAWHAAGRPAGSIKNYIDNTVPQLLHWIADRQDDGWPVYTGNVSAASNSTSFAIDNWRRGQHIIMVDHVNFDANGNPISLTLRDQVGPTYRTISDFPRLYFLIGRAVIYDML